MNRRWPIVALAMAAGLTIGFGVDVVTLRVWTWSLVGGVLGLGLGVALASSTTHTDRQSTRLVVRLIVARCHFYESL